MIKDIVQRIYYVKQFIDKLMLFRNLDVKERNIGICVFDQYGKIKNLLLN